MKRGDRGGGGASESDKMSLMPPSPPLLPFAQFGKNDLSRNSPCLLIQGSGLVTWMIRALGVPLKLGAIEVDVPQIAPAVALGLIVEMR